MSSSSLIKDEVVTVMGEGLQNVLIRDIPVIRLRRRPFMTRVLLDQTTLSLFYNPSEQVEVCDEAGRTLGYFTPVEDRSLYERVEVPFSEEELDRFEQEPGGRTLAEILADLERKP